MTNGDTIGGTSSFPQEPAGGAAPPPGGPAPPSRTGPPWEQEGQILTRFFETLRGVLLAPTALFGSMRRDGGLGMPLLYALVGGFIGGAAATIYQIFFKMGLGRIGETNTLPPIATTLLGGAYIAILPILIVISVFIGAGIYHLLLLLFGGAHFPFETTFRVCAYTTGSTAVLGVIPFCGGLIGGLWAIVVAILGLASAQETTVGRAAAAVLVPVVLCCVLVGLLVLMAFLLGFGAAAVLGGRQV